MKPENNKIGNQNCDPSRFVLKTIDRLWKTKTSFANFTLVWLWVESNPSKNYTSILRLKNWDIDILTDHTYCIQVLIGLIGYLDFK